MGAASRRKGARGQCEFSHMLTSRDWEVDPIACGMQREDLLATDRFGRRWSVEVKMTSAIIPAHRRQAQEEAKARGLPWMLANHIEGTESWLVQRQGEPPIIWHKRIGG